MPEKRVSAKLKKEVIERAQDCCEYCYSQAAFATHAFSVEHVIPIQKGGTSTLDNLALSCQGCNNFKYTKTTTIDPLTGNITPLYTPRQHLWDEHFAWNEDYSLMIGLTPIGRATIETLQLNRTGVVNLRRILYSVGKHPPLKKV